jgi:hypothetical protein
VAKIVTAPSLVSTATFFKAASLILYVLEESSKLKTSSLMRMQRSKVEIEKGLTAAQGITYIPPPRAALLRSAVLSSLAYCQVTDRGSLERRCRPLHSSNQGRHYCI